MGCRAPRSNVPDWLSHHSRIAASSSCEVSRGMNDARFERRYMYLRKLIDRRLASIVSHNEPHNLAEGLRYVLTAAGKRVRSTLVLLSCEAVGGHVKNAIDA